jgi:hypothetical protein
MLQPQCSGRYFEKFTANAVSVAIGDNRKRLILEIWWNFFYDLFSIKNVADVNSIDSFVSKRNMEEFSVVIMKRVLLKSLTSMLIFVLV